MAGGVRVTLHVVNMYDMMEGQVIHFPPPSQTEDFAKCCCGSLEQPSLKEDTFSGTDY